MDNNESGPFMVRNRTEATLKSSASIRIGEQIQKLHAGPLSSNSSKLIEMHMDPFNRNRINPTNLLISKDHAKKTGFMATLRK